MQFKKQLKGLVVLLARKLLTELQVWKTLRQNNSETVTNEHGKEISKERYISPEGRREIIDNLRLML